MNESLTTNQKLIIFMGFVLFIAHLGPIHFLSYSLTKVAFLQPVFQHGYLSYQGLLTSLQILVSSILVLAVFLQAGVFSRLSEKYASTFWMASGVLLQTSYLGITLFQKDSHPYLRELTNGHITPNDISNLAIALLLIGCVRVLFGLKSKG